MTKKRILAAVLTALVLAVMLSSSLFIIERRPCFWRCA